MDLVGALFLYSLPSSAELVQLKHFLPFFNSLQIFAVSVIWASVHMPSSRKEKITVFS